MAHSDPVETGLKKLYTESPRDLAAPSWHNVCTNVHSHSADEPWKDLLSEGRQPQKVCAAPLH